MGRASGASRAGGLRPATHADGGARRVGRPRFGPGPDGQLGAQETVGQVQLPLACTVTPKLLPLPLGFAVST